MARQPVVLEMLFRAAPAQQGSTNLLIFSLLVPFIHRDGAIGQQARDALLLVMAASASHEAVARYIAENSYFCPVSEELLSHSSFSLFSDSFTIIMLIWLVIDRSMVKARLKLKPLSLKTVQYMVNMTYSLLM